MASKSFPFPQKFLAALALTLLWAPTLAQALTGGPDSFGYTFIDSDEASGPAYQWIDISTTGQVVVDQGDDSSSYSSPPEGIGSAVTLGFPFPFHGESYPALVPASNGYLSSDPEDKGQDSTNDSTLPTSPDAGQGARL